MQLEKRKEYTLSEIISFFKSGDNSLGQDFCLYSKDPDDELSHDQSCYIDDYPSGDDDGNDIFPDFIQKNNLELIYYGEQLIDAITNINHQVKNPDISLIIKALNYFMDNDDFLKV